jgi:hypothetical protein
VAVDKARLETIAAAKDDWKRESSEGTLYAIIDSCDEPCVPKKAAGLGPARAVSLYRGSAEEQYELIAPYLFQVDAALFEWIEKELWRKPWGILISSAATLEELRTHFRHFLTVKGTDGKKYLLRFYDPRVLPGFLRSCDARERATFFGPVRSYGAKTGDGILLFRLNLGPE